MKKLIITALVALSGCSTMLNGTTQELALSDNCILAHSDKAYEVVSGVATVDRRNANLAIECGGTLQVVEPTWTTSAVVGGILLDGGLVDMATGAAYQYEVIQ